MFRKLLNIGVKFPTYVVFVFSILEILFNVNWIGQLDKIPILNGFYPWIDSHVPHIIIGTCIVWIVSKILLIYLEKKEDANSGNAMHAFCHELRNRLFELSTIDIDSYPKGKAGLEQFYSYVQRTSEGICRNIHGFLKAYTGKDFAVCIKLLKPSSSRQSTSKNEIEIMTLCREGAGKVERSQIDLHEKIRLVDNTDFELLFDSDGTQDSNIFAIPNLPVYIFQQYLSKNRYKTSTTNPLKRYHSTIVVPIRIPTVYLPEDRRNNSTYTLIAFLCVDYKHVISRKEMRRIKDYIKSMGDALYPFFDSVMLIDKSIRN